MSEVTRKAIASVLIAALSIFWLTWAAMVNPRPLLGLVIVSVAVTAANLFRHTHVAWTWLYRVGILAVAAISLWKYMVPTVAWTAAVGASMLAFMGKREIVKDLRFFWGA